MTTQKIIRLALLLLLCWGSPGSLAQEAARMGELLAAELGMHWVLYEDNVGHSRAVPYATRRAMPFFSESP